MPLKQRHLLTRTMQRCHRNIPAADNEEITSLPLPSAFQTTTYTHVPCSLQSTHTKGIGMITSIWNLPCEPFRFGTRTATPLPATQENKETADWQYSCTDFNTLDL